MKHPERIPEYLRHIIVACNRIGQFTREVTEHAFLSDLLIQEATLRSILVIGEASARVRDEDASFIEEHGLETFFKAIGIRNRIAHEYDSFDLKIAWGAVQRSVPALREKVLSVLYELGHRPDPDALHF